MPREPEIQPGSAFHLPATQQKNLGILLGVLNKKEAVAAITAIGKTDKTTWVNIKDTVVGLNEFVQGRSFTESIKDTVDTSLAAALSPFTNEINQAIADTFSPLGDKLSEAKNEITQFLSDELALQLKPLLTAIGDIAVDLTDFILSNPEGAIIGGITGYIVSLLVPGGILWVFLFSLVGSALQEALKTPVPGVNNPSWVRPEDPLGLTPPPGWTPPSLPPLPPGGPGRLGPEEEF